MISKCTTCGRQCWTCRACNNRTYCEFCNHCNLHGQEPPAPEMIRPPRQAARTAVRGLGRVPYETWMERGVLGPCAVGGASRRDLEGRAHRQTGASGATNPREAGQGQCGGRVMLISNGSHSFRLKPAATGTWERQPQGTGNWNWRLNGPQL